MRENGEGKYCKGGVKCGCHQVVAESVRVVCYLHTPGYPGRLGTCIRPLGRKPYFIQPTCTGNVQCFQERRCSSPHLDPRVGALRNLPSSGLEQASGVQNFQHDPVSPDHLCTTLSCRMLPFALGPRASKSPHAAAILCSIHDSPLIQAA